jgi:predicted DNA-binding transcriptional regulator AlpA
MATSTTTTTPPRWLGIAELERRLGVSRCSIWRWTKQGTFPAAAYFGSRRAWLESDIAAWETRQIEAQP